MKIILNDDINMIIFLNKIYLKNINFDNKEEIENYFQKLLCILRNYYKIDINGYYNIDVYIDTNYGIILEMKKEELEYFGYFEDEVDMQIMIHKCEFLYEIMDYFWIDKKLKEKVSLYKYYNKLYLLLDKKINDYSLGKIIENSKIQYKLDNKIIIKDKNLVNI